MNAHTRTHTHNLSLSLITFNHAPSSLFCCDKTPTVTQGLEPNYPDSSSEEEPTAALPKFAKRPSTKLKESKVVNGRRVSFFGGGEDTTTDDDDESTPSLRNRIRLRQAASESHPGHPAGILLSLAGPSSGIVKQPSVSWAGVSRLHIYLRASARCGTADLPFLWPTCND